MCPSLNFVGEKATLLKINQPMKCTDSCLIRQHALFCCLSEDRLDSLLQKAKIVDYPANAVIFCEGEPANKFYFILKGCVKAYRTTHEGDEHLIDIINSGELIGDSEIFDQHHYYHNITETTQATRLLCFSSDLFRELVHQDPKTANNLLSYFSKVLQQKNYDLEVIINCPARERVLIYFRELIEDHIKNMNIIPKQIEINLSMPKCQLAARLAMKPETLSRVLSELRNEGMIHVVRQKVVIKKVNLLIEYTR